MKKIHSTELLYEIGKTFTAMEDINSLLQEVLNVLARHLPMKRSMITVYQPETEDISIDVSFGYSDEQISRGRYKPGEGVIGSVISTGKAVIIPSVQDEPRFLNKTGARGTGDSDTTAFICVPIKNAGGTIGTISIDILNAGDISLEHVSEIITYLAVMISHAVLHRREMRLKAQMLENENRLLKKKLSLDQSPRKLIGNSKAMEDLYEKILMVADTDSTVLITGESGTGKELVAHEVHHNGSRKDRPYIKVNISAIPETLIESELFGHEKGAFTGALKQKKGKFELARGGTIFLDEIGDLSMHLQVHLLRVLQEKSIERLGGSETISLDVRIIAATHQDLEKKIREGSFREDLFYRLNVFPIYAPPLRERKADIMLLADHFLELYAGKFNKKINRISSDAIDLLTSYHWPGNVRELENCMERAVIMSTEDVIRNYHLPPSLQSVNKSAAAPRTLDEMTDLFVREIIIDHLKMTDGNITRAAEMLGTTKRILTYRVNQLGIEYAKYRRES
ncbi:MAG TPA: sigma 54-interacting transcriptional regulator [Spirochaetota bacterium]|nr:sigma 54-interacting transcriptional regulator [Spirochaetota bacterium]HQO00867.1 sigma 54-interacting transcriptional regulator [Spirochaetota bacterium]HQP47687.1 sigma 54-interacting transcriptional regulator [Spirochaetota bacterium]